MKLVLRDLSILGFSAHGRASLGDAVPNFHSDKRCRTVTGPITRFIARFVLVLGFLTIATSAAMADSVTVGVVSFDVVNPGATNAFTVYNLTGPFSLFPDFPVADPLTFTGISLTLTESGSSTPFLLPDAGPGSEQLLVLNTDSFTQAAFQANLNQSIFALGDGTIFQASSGVVTATLLPSSGNDLTPGVDFAYLTVSGSPVTIPIPEPSTLLLLLAATPCVLGLRKILRRRQS